MVNKDFKMCASYPPELLVPASISDQVSTIINFFCVTVAPDNLECLYPVKTYKAEPTNLIALLGWMYSYSKMFDSDEKS